MGAKRHALHYISPVSTGLGEAHVLVWSLEEQREESRPELHDITSTNCSRLIKSSRAHSERNLTDIKTALIFEEEEWTTCRKPPLR